jgi:hypothetical protein
VTDTIIERDISYEVVVDTETSSELVIDTQTSQELLVDHDATHEILVDCDATYEVVEVDTTHIEVLEVAQQGPIGPVGPAGPTAPDYPGKTLIWAHGRLQEVLLYEDEAKTRLAERRVLTYTGTILTSIAYMDGNDALVKTRTLGSSSGVLTSVTEA